MDKLLVSCISAGVIGMIVGGALNSPLLILLGFIVFIFAVITRIIRRHKRT